MMRAYFLVKNGDASKAFELRETEKPALKDGEVMIKVEAFGLNFADVMARNGLYPEAPAKPGILGYDVVGTIVELANPHNHLSVGQRVLAMTRFGGYAEYVTTPVMAVVPISDKMDPVIAAALPIQGATAVFMMDEMVSLHPGDHVLIHSGAGGVGSILIQLALAAGCRVYATAGGPEKIKRLNDMGVHVPIDYKSLDFAKVVQQRLGSSEKHGIDVIFDAVGGASIKKGMKLLDAGGRLVMYGAASFTDAQNIFSKVSTLLSFGIYHPLNLMTPSKSLMGVNMLKIADNRPDVMQRVLQKAVALTEKGIIKPFVGGLFPHEQLAEAHELLASRGSMGKLAVKW